MEQVNYLNVADLHSDVVFEDLSKHNDVINLADYDANMLKGYCEMNGMLMGLPTGINGQVIAYNQTLLDKYGLKIDASWDWSCRTCVILALISITYFIFPSLS